MNTAHLEHHDHLVVQHEWLDSYSRFLTGLVSLRTLAQRNANMGILREDLRKQSIELINQADQLHSRGYRVYERFADDERLLWNQIFTLVAELPWQTVPYNSSPKDLVDDYTRMQQSWDRFEHFVVHQLPDDFFDHLSALDPKIRRANGLKWLTGEQRSPVPTGRLPVSSHANVAEPHHVGNLSR